MNDLAELLRDLQRGLDEHDRRLAALEQSPLLAFRMEQAIEQRRAAVARLRAEGLSAERIARGLGAGRSTIWRDLKAAGIPTPERTVGVNGRGWSRRNGSTRTP